MTVVLSAALKVVTMVALLVVLKVVLKVMMMVAATADSSDILAMQRVELMADQSVALKDRYLVDSMVD